MGATFNRLKTWVNETLNATDVNAEFDNVLDNLTPTGTDDHSTNAAQMQLQTDPGSQGSESLATSLAGELQRLRYVISRIIGGTYWYDSPGLNISQIDSALDSLESTGDRIVSGKSTTGSSQSYLITPAGSGNGDGFTINATATDLVLSISDTLYTLSSDIAQANTSTAPVTNNTATIASEGGFTDESWTAYHGSYGGGLAISSVGSEIQNLTGKRATFRHGTEYFTAMVDNNVAELVDLERGIFFDENGAGIAADVFTDGDTITLMNTSHIFTNSTGTLSITNNWPIYSDIEPTSPATGDYWYDISAEVWKKYDGGSYNTVAEIYLGMAITDENDDCVAARSSDFFRRNSDRNDLELVRGYADIAGDTLEPLQDCIINVYGNNITLYNNTSGVKWEAAQLDTGTISANTLYFYYLTDEGQAKISLQAPVDMRKTRGGLYHPHQTWRAVGQAYYTSTTVCDYIISYNDGAEFRTDSTATASAGVLTYHYFASPLVVQHFRSEWDGTNGTRISRRSRNFRVPYYMTIVVDSGATLGHLVSNVTGESTYDNVVFHVGQPTNQSSIYPLISSHQYGQYDNEVTSSAMNGTSSVSGALYSNVSLSNISVKALSWGQEVYINGVSTAGTWTGLNYTITGSNLDVCRTFFTHRTGTVSESAGTRTEVTNWSTFGDTGKATEVKVQSVNQSSSSVGVFQNAATQATGYVYLQNTVPPAAASQEYEYLMQITAASGNLAVFLPTSAISRKFSTRESCPKYLSIETSSGTVRAISLRVEVRELPFGS